MELPATDAIRPMTEASPWAGAREVLVDVTVDVEVDVDAGVELFDEPQAAADSAAAPVAARMANRVSVTGIKVSPLVVGPRKGVPV
ncbi:hypothetical protein A5736_01805 [Mycobacterium sp. SP-6446]|nr:hypothetical protein A5736_01805 [Mycobacterium sp. SP-6446]